MTHPPEERLRARQGRRTIATFDTYAEAERAVDHLSDRRFPVERVAVVGRDLVMIEQVIGRLTHAGAALRGAASGAVIGALFGWLFGLFDWIDPVITGLLLALYGLVFGAIAGALLGLLFHALQGGRRDFDAVQTVQPTQFEVIADVEVADEGERLLAELNPPSEPPAPVRRTNEEGQP